MLFKIELPWIILFCTSFPIYSTINCNREMKCKTTRIHGLKISDCYDMDWKEIPKCLPSSIEVIELTQNRIRRINEGDLQRYSNLAHLYLRDNLLVNLGDDTFSDMTRLETLDLSMNALAKIPASIFQLPSLKTLYLSSNMNMNIAESIEEAKPISGSTLTKLDISDISDSDYPADFPDFSEMPLLADLNITGNVFNIISPEHFANLCNLQILSNDNVTANFLEDCDCWKINEWLTERKLKFSPFACPIKKQDCPGQEISEDHLELFEKCSQRVKQFRLARVLRKVGLWAGIVGGCILLLAVITVYWLRKKRRHKRLVARKMFQLKDATLLNNKPTN